MQCVRNNPSEVIAPHKQQQSENTKRQPGDAETANQGLCPMSLSRQGQNFGPLYRQIRNCPDETEVTVIAWLIDDESGKPS